MKQENLIIIFTRNPELGKVKTRLAKAIGNESALDVYKFLLNHTEKTIRDIKADKAVYYSVKVRENDLWDASIYQKHLQKGNDLGIRMYNAFKNGFDSNYKKILIVGSDLYDLNAKHIEQAFSKLNDHDVVIGPAEDGGYYLLGMKSLNPEVFNIENWGTETVYEQTVSKLINNSMYVLEILNDIDYVEDLKPYKVFEKYFKNN